MLEIIEDEKYEKVILRVAGRLDATSVPILEEKFADGLEEGKKDFVIDCRKLEYLSSAGMRLLLSYTRKCKNQEGFLHLFGLGKEILEIIKMGGFEQILHIYNEEKEALQVD